MLRRDSEEAVSLFDTILSLDNYSYVVNLTPFQVLEFMAEYNKLRPNESIPNLPFRFAGGNLITDRSPIFYDAEIDAALGGLG